MTSIHQSTIQRFVDAGYRTGGFKEFCRLVYSLEDDAGLKCIDSLAEFFQSRKNISRENCCALFDRLTIQFRGDVSPYSECRQDAPVAERIPDAWRYAPNPDAPGKMRLEIIEVLDTSRTGVEKLADYAANLDHYSETDFVVYEVSARDGAVVQHDSLHAWWLRLERGVISAKTDEDLAVGYADHMAGR